MADGRHFLTRVTWQQDFPAGQIRKGLLAARFHKGSRAAVLRFGA